MMNYSPNRSEQFADADCANQLDLFPEPYFTIPKASAVLGLKTHAVRRAVKQGYIPSYKPFSSRIYVKLSEIEKAITAFNHGGEDNA